MPAAGMLILKGNLAIGPRTSGVDTTDEDAAIDVGLEIIRFVIKAMVDTIEIPATMGSPLNHRGGAAEYAIELGYLAEDGTTGLVVDLLHTAAASTSKELGFWGSMRSSAISATNPLWSGTFIVTQSELGGDAEALSQGAATYPLVSAPVQVTVDY